MKQNVGKKIVNIIVIVILVFVFFMTLNILLSYNKGYVPVFGKAAVAVKSDSMKGDKADSFETGDILFIKIINSDEAAKLEVGDVVTFKTKINGKDELNTHRIITVNRDDNGGVTSYRTQGDANNTPDGANLLISNVVGVYRAAALNYEGGKIGGIGNFTIWLSNPETNGFLYVVVIPSILLVVYCVFTLVLTIKDRNLEQVKVTEKEKMRAEILAELKAQETKESNEGESKPDDEKKE